jgi:hypothetical protein
MGKVEATKRNWKKALLGVVAVTSIIWLSSPVNAVGPYFENESPGRGQFEGPTPSWPSPEASLWSPPVPLFIPQESLKKSDTLLRSLKESGKAEAAPRDVVPVQPNTYTAQR